jgi:hypothetical protein
VSELHPRLAELRVELERTRTALLETIAAVPADAAATVPAPGTWSVAEIVEHLQIVEDGIGRRLASSRSKPSYWAQKRNRRQFSAPSTGSVSVYEVARSRRRRGSRRRARAPCRSPSPHWASAGRGCSSC